ncbi:MAG: RHS repeat-associated core domain-containing protein [Chthonomonadaceae bacterium]|nr:RHS repeat-associated core domain-containing protein [Chthonomonadaceae bacterium]
MAGGTSTFQHGGLKSLDAQTDTSQSISGTKTYDAFGATGSSTGSWQGQSGFGGGFGYQPDSDTGLQLLGHRYYDPTTGRFLSRDPAKDGPNWYAYCLNDPVNRADPSGLTQIKAYWYHVIGWGYHLGLSIENNVKSSKNYGKRYLVAGGPERYTFLNEGLLVSKSGLHSVQEEGKKRRVGLSEGVMLANDQFDSWDNWVGLTELVEQAMDGKGRFYYDAQLINSNSWSFKIMKELGLLDEYYHAMGKREKLHVNPNFDGWSHGSFYDDWGPLE